MERIRPGTLEVVDEQRELEDEVNVSSRKHDVFYFDEEPHAAAQLSAAEYASLYRQFYRRVRGASETARVSPAGDVFSDDQDEHGNPIPPPFFTEFHRLRMGAAIDEWRMHISFRPPTDNLASITAEMWEEAVETWMHQVRKASDWSRQHGAPMVLSTFPAGNLLAERMIHFDPNLLERMFKCVYDDRNIVEALWMAFDGGARPLSRENEQLNDLGITFKRESDRYDFNLYVIKEDEDALYGGLVEGIYLYDYGVRNHRGWRGQHLAVAGVGLAWSRFLFKSVHHRIYGTQLSRSERERVDQNGWYAWNELLPILESDVYEFGPLTVYKNTLLAIADGKIFGWRIGRRNPPTLTFMGHVTQSSAEDDAQDWFDVESMAAADGILYSVWRGKLYGHDIHQRSSGMFVGRGVTIDVGQGWGAIAAARGYLYVVWQGNLYAHAIGDFTIGERVLVKNGGFENVKAICVSSEWADA